VAGAFHVRRLECWDNRPDATTTCCYIISTVLALCIALFHLVTCSSPIELARVTFSISNHTANCSSDDVCLGSLVVDQASLYTEQ